MQYTIRTKLGLFRTSYQAVPVFDLMRSMAMPKRSHQMESFDQAEQGMGVGEGHAVIGADGRAVVERTINWVASCVLY
jgi:hypothetical protein